MQDVAAADLAAARGVAIREFPLLPGHGFADYLLYVDGKACGVIEAKKQGATLTGVEAQSARYALGLPPSLPAWRMPLPFVYESTGVETHFTQRQMTWRSDNPDRRWSVYEYDELVARDKASLDIFWLHDESQADSDNLSPPEVIEQEIVDVLEAALEQFRLIAADTSLADTP